MKKSRCYVRVENRRTLRSSSSAKAQHAYGGPKPHVSYVGSKRTGSGRRSSGYTPIRISPARSLLLQVQKVLETEGRRRTTSIMDVILDTKQYRTDKLLEAAQCNRPWNWQNFDFIDEDSLEAYWVSQAAIWKNMRFVEPASESSPQYPVSTERSTALWSTALDGDFGRDCDRQSSDTGL
jgi:hypothetical protein